MLEDRVRDDRRPVDERGDVGRRNAAFRHGREHGALGLGGRGYHFARCLDVIIAGQHPVGEGASHFDAQPQSSRAEMPCLHLAPVGC